MPANVRNVYNTYNINLSSAGDHLMKLSIVAEAQERADALAREHIVHPDRSGSPDQRLTNAQLRRCGVAADTLVRYADALRESRTVGQMDTVFDTLRRAMGAR